LRRSKRTPKLAVLLAIAVLALGLGTFLFGHALGALLVTNCPDFQSRILPVRCQQPGLYVGWGLRLMLVGAVAAVGSVGWLLLHHSR
jgi:hypothetical protein